MHRLRLFGGLVLEDDGGAVSGRAAQRHRLALLALLSSAPGQAMSRDKLVGLLWPEKDAEQARHLLAVAVYELRKALGEEALQSRGDDVALGPARPGSDAAEFAEALAAGDAERAIALYAGPFLDGFFLSEAEEFEKWVDAERERLAQAYHGALEQVAESRAARGDVRGAVEAWRALAASDPFNSRVALCLMRALAESGDRLGALQFARVHAALLREELDVDPDPAIQALAERLREEPGTLPEPAEAPAQATPAPAAAAPMVETLVAAPPAASSADPPRAGGRRAGRSRIRSVWALRLSIVAVVGMVAFWARQVVQEPLPQAAEDARIRIAVLPFRDRSPDGADRYYAEGLADELADALGRAGVAVPARSIVHALGDSTIGATAAAGRLDVQYVVEGSIHKSADQLRLSVQLIRGGDGLQVWGGLYDPVTDVFETQEAVARAIVDTLRIAPRDAPKGRLTRLSTVDTAAYDAYLRGRGAWLSRAPDRLSIALDAFHDAVRHDSAYALAWVGIADVYSQLGAYDSGLRRPQEVYPQARAAAERALRLDPELPEAHAALAQVLFNYDRDMAAAEREFRRALELNPGYALAHHWLALLLVTTGREQEALAEARAARQMEPLSPVVGTSLARQFYHRRDFPQAIRHYQEALELDPGFHVTQLGLGLTYALGGQHDLALEHYRRAGQLLGDAPLPVLLALRAHALGLAGRRAEATALRARLQQLERAGAYVSAEYYAIIAIALGEADEAVRWMEKAFENRSPAIAYLRVEPLLDPIRGHPGFQKLVAQIQS